MGKPCDICGDIGIAEAIVTCSKCHKFREHIYCMHPNLCSVPESWCCESCLYNVHVHDNHHSESSTHHEQVVDLSREANACAMANESSKMGDIWKQEGSLRSNILPTPNTACTGHPECPTVGRVRANDLEKLNRELSQPVYCCKSSLKFPDDSLTTEKIESVVVITTKDKSHINDEAQCSSLNYNRPLVCGVKVKSQIKDRLLGVDKQPGKIGSLISKDCVRKEKPVDAVSCCQGDDTLYSRDSYIFGEEDLVNPPAVNALWKGSFAVLDFYDELYDGVEAFPPRKLARKAYEISKEMPSMLQFELKSRLHVWPMTFQRDPPSEFDIALYFRADDQCRSRGNYNHLKEWMVEKDLSMVSRFKGTELLIYTSSQLPVESQRLNEQFYLWGVFSTVEERHSYADFRGKGEFNFPLLSCQIGEGSVTSNANDDHIVDMEIDMEGTKEAGSVDICSRRNSNVVCWENLDIPSQDAFIKGHFDLSRYLHQTKREPFYDFDVPPGFQRQVALTRQESSVLLKGRQHLSEVPVPSSKIHEEATGVIDKVDNQDADTDAPACLYKSDPPSQDVFGRGNLAHLTQENATAMRLHQTQLQQCHVDARISRPITSDAADKGLISTSILTVSPIHHKECASPGVFDTTMLAQGDSSAKQQRYNIHHQELLMRQTPIQKHQVMMQQASIQQQQSMYQPTLLPLPKVEEIPSDDLPPGFEQPPQMKAIQSRNLFSGSYQKEPARSGDVPPGFDQPSVHPSPPIDLISSGNLCPRFDTSTCHCVYVSNIPPQVKIPLFQEIFKVAGAVEGCKLTEEGESLCGFVNYFDHQSAERAISTLNGRQLFGQPIKVCWAQESLPRGPFNIFVGNLCPQVTDVNLFVFFSVFPSCLSARVVRDQIHGWSKLFGFVSFGNQKEAQDAIHKFNGNWLGSRQIRCNWATIGAGSSHAHL